MVVKVLAAIAVAAVLILISSRKWRSRGRNDRVLRSLPGSLVQEIADRLDAPEELLAYLKTFFGTAYHGGEQAAEDAESLQRMFPSDLPPEELHDLIRTAGVMEADALLAYACPVPERDRPAVITVCRNGEKKGLLIGVFLPD